MCEERKQNKVIVLYCVLYCFQCGGGIVMVNNMLANLGGQCVLKDRNILNGMTMSHLLSMASYLSYKSVLTVKDIRPYCSDNIPYI